VQITGPHSFNFFNNEILKLSSKFLNSIMEEIKKTVFKFLKIKPINVTILKRKFLLKLTHFPHCKLNEQYFSILYPVLPSD
jgi:hypothetical protein